MKAGLRSRDCTLPTLVITAEGRKQPFSGGGTSSAPTENFEKDIPNPILFISIILHHYYAGNQYSINRLCTNSTNVNNLVNTNHVIDEYYSCFDEYYSCFDEQYSIFDEYYSCFDEYYSHFYDYCSSVVNITHHTSLFNHIFSHHIVINFRILLPHMYRDINKLF